MVEVANFSSAKNSLKTHLDFETQLKEKLKWNRNVWEQSEGRGTRLHKLINSMNYWKKQLKPAMEDCSMVFTIFHEESDVRYDISQIISVIENVDKAIEVKGFSSFRNPRYLCMYFENKEIRDLVVNNFKMVENGYVAFLHWACDERDRQDILRVHWLPMTFSLDLIKNELIQYVNFIDQEREALKMMSGREVPSGKVTFKMVLKQGVTAEDIPHTTKIGNMEALITVPGRKPLCLNCSSLGHISKNCKLRFCQNCADLLPKSHECSAAATKVSYAGAVKGKGNGNDFIQEEDWEAAFEEQQDKIVSKEGNELSDKIIKLEKQLCVLKSGSFVPKQIILDGKRADERSGVIITGSEENVKLDFAGSEEKSESEDDTFYEEDVGNTKDDSDENQMVIESSQVNSDTNEGESKKKKKKRKHRATESSSDGSEMFTPEKIGGGELIRSYGKPNFNNQRRMKQDQAYNKICQKSPDNREFVFKD